MIVSKMITVDQYSPVGDLVCIVFCWAMLILVTCAYVRRTRSFTIFRGILLTLMVAAYGSLIYRSLLSSWQASYYIPVIASRLVMHTALFASLFLFMVYIAEVARLEKESRHRVILSAGIASAAFALYDLIGTVTGGIFRIDPDGQVYTGPSVFSFGYLALLLMNVSLMLYVRRRVYKRLMVGFFLMVFLAALINLLQRMNGQSSFTVVSFALPDMAMLYFMHSNPYDTQLGAVDPNSLADYVQHAEKRHRPFGYMSLYMPAFDLDDPSQSIPEEVQAAMRKVSDNAFRSSTLFFVGRGHYILVYPLHKNEDAQERIRKTMDFFMENYNKFQYDYKIVIGQADENHVFRDYIGFIRNIHYSMKMNSVHVVKSDERGAYAEYEYILHELTDIYNRHDLDDPRVLVYCQPVWDISLSRFDTAEALMRLNLEKTGLVLPDRFISIAEENGFIHTLTEIILHKTCEEIRKLTREGYQFSRISVNISAQELKEGTFCQDITRIISQSGIDSSRIALELTESENESDFRIAQDRINHLRKMSIQFYLDDFGTGYSNMDRIMQLPFDIIKFDRTLVTACRTDPKAAVIIKRLAQLFEELKYTVLYEGVETEDDAERCRDMSAFYLQGTKYSAPVPIAEMKNFFAKADGAERDVKEPA